MTDSIFAYAGRILRVDLSSGKTWADPFDAKDRRKWIGGTGLGAKILWEEVAPVAGWDHPENRLVMATGPLAGLPVWGTGGLTVVTRGALTNGATNTQANGFFGANLKFCGFDAIVFQGQSPEWVYLHVHDDGVELRDASSLLGKDTWETQQALEEATGLSGHNLSVYSIGPAGENLVRFAAIQGDYGHVASKNGCGAVMGKKRLKAVVIERGKKGIAAAHPRALYAAADEIAHNLKTDASTRGLYLFGTLGGVRNLCGMGALPIRNYTTNVWPEDVDTKKWEGKNLREGFDHRGHQCSACGMYHCHMYLIASGLHKGEVVDEPEYEGWSGAGWAIGATEPSEVAWLNTRLDRACVDVNEFGWLCGWVMECQQKGYISDKDLGFRLEWGDVEGANRLLQMICQREGLGDLLAEGVKRAAEKLGGEAAGCAIYTEIGNTPRGHDHRSRWEEMIDTCTGSGGTLDTAPPVRPTEFGLPARIEPQDPEAVPRQVGVLRGRRFFEDSLGACSFTVRVSMHVLCRSVEAATGWDLRMEEAIRNGRRTAALMRAFNLRCGIGPELEKPSKRYSLTPVDGPVAGVSILDHWEKMLDIWYETVGYDRKTGRPTPETLRSLGLEEVIESLWGAGVKS
ncbi:MAG: aldehyde ferredoxin oxidoreductase family protein [Nitrospinota bacterium]